MAARLVHAARVAAHLPEQPSSQTGQPEHAAELGTPLNPTPQMTTQDLGTVHGSYQAMLDSYTAQGREAQERQNDLER
jgi:hypothetical protein